jgi:excisionase family DNA binding protein
MSNVVVISPEDLRSLISAAVQEVLRPLSEEVEELKQVVVEKADEPMNAEQAADFLRCSVKTVIRYHKEEGLPAVRRGRDYKFMRSQLREWMRSPAGERLAKALQGRER